MKAAKVPELKGSPKLLTNKSSIKLKNFKVFGSNNLNIPIRMPTPTTLAIKNPEIGLSLNESKISF